MPRLLTLTASLLAALALAAGAHGSPGTDAQAAAIADQATITYVGDSWGPLPLWRLEYPGASVDINAVDAADAKARFIAWLSPQLPVIEADKTSPLAPVVTGADTVAAQKGGAPIPKATDVEIVPVIPLPLVGPTASSSSTDTVPETRLIVRAGTARAV